jgi:hypothetical protein
MTDETRAVTAKERFTSADSKRDQVLQRARDCADLTIPALMPPEGADENTSLPTPYQSLGSRGVNNLTSKLRLALFPPGNPFFRFKIDDETMAALGATNAKAAQQVEKVMMKMEQLALDELEQGSDSVTLHAAIKQLVTVGNVLLHFPRDDNSRIFRLTNYVVLRDASGNWYEIVAKEVLNRITIKPEVLAAVGEGPDKKDEEDLVLYTHVQREGNKAMWYQEINENIVPGSEGSSKYDDCPYIPLRWAALDNENYGRGHVEEYLGDLRSLEDLSKALVQFSAAAAKVIFLDRPNSTTDLEAIQQAESGEFVEGNIEDIGVLQLQKYADFQVAKSQIDDLSLRLSHAFLLTTGTVRQAERVTAEEIRMQAQELEDVLGGVYTVLAAEMQRKVVNRLVARLKAKNLFPQMPEGAVTPVLVTGLEALGRGHELNKWRAFFSDGVSLFGEGFLAGFDPAAVAQLFATHHNLDIEGIQKTPEQMAQEQQAAMQQTAVEKGMAPAVSGAMDMAQSQMEE